MNQAEKHGKAAVVNFGPQIWENPIVKKLAKAYSDAATRLHSGRPMLDAVPLWVGLGNAFHSLANGAMNVNAGKQAGIDLTPKGDIARLERRGGEFEAADPSFPRYIHNPCQELATWRTILAKGDALAKQKENVGECKKLAFDIAHTCSLWRDMAFLRADSILEREAMFMIGWAGMYSEAAQIAEAEAREADAKAEMYRARGEAETETKARERAETKREEAEKRAAEKRAEAKALRGKVEERGRTIETLQGMIEDLQATMSAQAGTADKTAKAHALVLAFMRFFDWVGPTTKPGSKKALDTFPKFLRDPQNKAALGRAKSFRTFRKKYGEWLDFERPDTGAAYLQKLAEAKRQKDKERRARG